MIGHFRWILAAALGFWLTLPGSLRADNTNIAPDFQAVFQLLRDNLPGATDASLNRAAVDGLLAQFPDQVSIVGGSSGDDASADALGKTTVLEGDVAYLRINRVAAGLADELKTAFSTLATTNKLAGAVLDLRFAGGDDSSAAQTQAEAIRTIFRPLTILVNGETHGAAESLAGALRAANAGLIIGSPTAGATATFKDLPLPDGERLRINTTNRQPTAQVIPDIAVTVDAKDERAYLADPYAVLSPAATTPAINTNDFLPFIDHTSEADLVRAKIKDGDEDENTPARPTEPPKPFIHDPALARALDLVKGLAAWHLNRS